MREGMPSRVTSFFNFLRSMSLPVMTDVVSRWHNLKDSRMGMSQFFPPFTVIFRVCPRVTLPP